MLLRKSYYPTTLAIPFFQYENIKHEHHLHDCFYSHEKGGRAKLRSNNEHHCFYENRTIIIHTIEVIEILETFHSANDLKDHVQFFLYKPKNQECTLLIQKAQ